MTALSTPTCTKVWAMPAPAGETFQVKPIRAFIDRYLQPGMIVVDPFARNAKIATITNDLNPETTAQFHLDSADFLRSLADSGVVPDVVLFDPPYSPRQIKELYDGIGLKGGRELAHRSASWKVERDIIASIMNPGGIVLSFGWNTLGMGKVRNYLQLEVLVICHGAAHNDTLCVADVKRGDGN